MKPSEIRLLSTAEIKAKLNELHEEKMNLRFQEVTGQLTDFSRMKEVRRDVARLETILRENEIKSEKEGVA